VRLTSNLQHCFLLWQDIIVEVSGCALHCDPTPASIAVSIRAIHCHTSSRSVSHPSYRCHHQSICNTVKAFYRPITLHTVRCPFFAPWILLSRHPPVLSVQSRCILYGALFLARFTLEGAIDHAPARLKLLHVCDQWAFCSGCHSYRLTP
jgi:hypothetical protein